MPGVGIIHHHYLNIPAPQMWKCLGLHLRKKAQKVKIGGHKGHVLCVNRDCGRSGILWCIILQNLCQWWFQIHCPVDYIDRPKTTHLRHKTGKILDQFRFYVWQGRWVAFTPYNIFVKKTGTHKNSKGSRFSHEMFNELAAVPQRVLHHNFFIIQCVQTECREYVEIHVASHRALERCIYKGSDGGQ